MNRRRKGTKMVQRDFKGSELILCVIVISIYTVINLSKPKKYTIK